MDFEKLYGHAPVGICYFGADLRYVYVNDWLATLNGLPVQQHLGQKIGDIRPNVAAAVEGELRRVLETGEPFAFDERIVRPDGTVRALQSKGSVVTDEEGRPIAMIGSCHDGTERKEAEQRAQRPRDQLRALHSRVEQLREEERKALARELHDEIGQTMVALQFHLSWLGGQELSDEAIGRLKAASELVVTVLQAGQRMSTRLRPVVLDGLGLFTAIECEVGEFRWRTGLEWELSLNVEEWMGGLDRATAVYRILQESLTNVERHSEATHVWVSIEGENGSIVVRVEDNGRGFGQDRLQASGELGVLGMQERAIAWGGAVSIQGVPDEGTTVIATIPVQ